MGHVYRFFVPPHCIINKKVFIKGHECLHIKRVLRLSSGDTVEIFDGVGNKYIAELIHVANDEVAGNIVKKTTDNQNAVRIVLGQGIPRLRKMDIIVQKATELGVSDIVPLITAKTGIKIYEKTRVGKKERWQKIACEAAKQCGRSYIPRVSDITPFDAFCESQKGSFLKIVLWEEETGKLREALKGLNDIKKKAGHLSILIGPEGGIDKKEIETARAFGFLPAGLGPNILRTETASLTVLSIIQFLLGNMG